MSEYNYAAIEKKWQKFWLDHKTFKTPDHAEGKKKFYCLDMFPYPSGAGLHVGHPEGYTATDILCRYKRMKGFKPVKWFVFDGNSFNGDGVAYIEIPDQSKPNVPGFDYGWHYYLGTTFMYNSSLSDGSSGLYSTELLRADHTNRYNTIVSP